MKQEMLLEDREHLPIGYSKVCPFAIEKCLAPQNKEICESFCLDNRNLCGNFLENSPVSYRDFYLDFEEQYEMCTRVINRKRRLIIAQIQASVEYEEEA